MDRVTIEIDPNVRIERGQTFSRLTDADGPVVLNDLVRVVEPESGLAGNGRVAKIDAVRGFVVLEVDWASLQPGRSNEAPRRTQQSSSGTFRLMSNPADHPIWGASVRLPGEGYFPSPASNGSVGSRRRTLINGSAGQQSGIGGIRWTGFDPMISA